MQNTPASFPVEQMEKYMYARKHAPHPEVEAYNQILTQRAAKSTASMQVIGMLGQDQVLAAGESPNGGVEMMVRKADGVVVLLMPDLPQVKNTPKGPVMVKTQMPLQLPLVRCTAPRPIALALGRLFKQPQRALLLFQGRFSTAAREVPLW
jgi:hypothetical protein